MLSPPAEPVEAPEVTSFDILLQQTAVPIVVDFWAPWCAPCRMMAPQLEIAARSMAGRALVVKVNTDAVPELGERFRILSIPTLAVFREGREISRVSGVRSAAEIEALVAQPDVHVGGR
jgi:thioredoxin 2